MLQLHLLGQPRLVTNGQELPLGLGKPALLLYYLAYYGDWRGREALTFLFWPDIDEFTARRNLRQLLHRIKDLPWATTLKVQSQRLRFAVETDVARFREAIDKRDWANAVEAYRGPLLESANASPSGFEAWLELERASLQHLWREAALHHSQELAQQARHAEAARLLKRLLDEDVLAEDVLQHYLQNAYLAGQRDLALKAYEAFRQQLRREMDLEPLEATVKLAETIRRAQPLETLPLEQLEPATVPLSVLSPPRLIGRQLERVTIARTDTAVVLIAGEPGIGKSRLLTELVPGAPMLRCQEGLASVPYHAVTHFIHEQLARGVSLPDLGAYREDLARLVPEVAPDIIPAPIEAQVVKARLLEALASYLVATATTLPDGKHSLCFDDLQWADAATLELLSYLSGRTQLRVFGSYRSNETSPALDRCQESLRSLRRLTIVKLEPLTEDEVKHLLAELMGRDEGPRLFSRWLHKSTGGNPMFMLETLKSMFESGVLREDQQGWHTAIDDITLDYHELEVPSAVAEVIRRRIQRLSEATRRMLQAASVIREGFDAPLLSQVVTLSEWAVIEALEEAEEAGLIGEGAFSHDLVRQTVYASLSPLRRRLLHARVAEALEGRAEALVLAEHWHAGGHAQRASMLWQEAAASYRRRGLHQEAVAVLERAATQVSAGAERLLVQTQLAQVYTEVTRYSEAEALVAEVLIQSSDSQTRAQARNVQARIHYNQGNLKEAAQAAAQALELSASEDEDSLIDPLLLQAEIAQLEGRSQDAITLLTPLVESLRQKPPSTGLISMLTSLGAAYDELGQAETGLGFHQEALKAARQVGARYAQVNVVMNLLWCLMALGRTQEGIADAEEALALGEYDNTSTLQNNLAAAYMTLGCYEEARHHYELIARNNTNLALRCIAWGRLAELYQRLHLPAQRDAAIQHGIEGLEKTDFTLAHVRMIIAVLNYGTPQQLEEVKVYFPRVPLDPWLQEELEQAKASRGI